MEKSKLKFIAEEFLWILKTILILVISSTLLRYTFIGMYATNLKIVVDFVLYVKGLTETSVSVICAVVAIIFVFFVYIFLEHIKKTNDNTNN